MSSSFTSIEHGSQMLFEFPCKPCSNRNRHVDSARYCLKCKELLCQACVDQHARDHKLIIQCLDVVNVDLSGVRGHSGGTRNVPGVCCVTRGGERFTVISDWYNAMLLVLNKTFQIVCRYQCDAKPYGICELIDIQRIAVTFRNTTELVLFSVMMDGKLIKDKKFTVPKSCRGITAFQETFTDTIVVVNGGTSHRDPASGGVNAFNVGGIHGDVSLFPILQAAATDGSQAHTPLSPRNVSISKDKSKILFTDSTIGALVMDKKGVVEDRNTLKHSTLQGARGICVGEDGEIYVSGEGSNNVVKFQSDGTHVGEILDQVHHGIIKPISLYFDPVRKYLFVGCGDGNAPLFYVRC